MAVRLVSVSLALITLSNLAEFVHANAFLGRGDNRHATAALSAESEHALLAALEVAFGGAHRHATEKRLKRIEDMMRPMFAAVAKNENGKLGPAAAAYVLHRAFVQRHGWFIRALEPEGRSLAAWNSSSPTSMLDEIVPPHITQLFEDRLGDRGLGLRELAMLASTLEHMVHTEALERLKVAYLASNYSLEDVLSQEEAIDVLDMYMSIYIFGSVHSNLSTLTPNLGRQMRAKILDVYPEFPATQKFVQEVYHSVAPKRDYVYFNEMENVIAEVSDRYGRFADIECRQFKDWLVAVEDPGVGGAGRVRIADFYGQALNNEKWQFSESVDYLRQLGALDESDPSNLRVIIPNYNYGPSNCVASSAFYSVCCIDECEGILGRLEELVAAPEASATMIRTLIPMISSATMPSNRTLSQWLHQRLDEVAAHHGGLVPLHGRLFAQWLHYAYPRECSFPHIAGTVNPQRPEDIRVAEGTTEHLTVDKSVMEGVVAEAAPLKRRTPGAETDATEESGMWAMHEELVVWRSPEEQEKPSLMRYSGPLVFVAAVASLSGALFKTLEPALKDIHKDLTKASSAKYYV
jgi:hypothetical protein